MNDAIIRASLDQAILAIDDLEDGHTEVAATRALISAALGNVAGAERAFRPNSSSPLPTVGERWVEEIETLAGSADKIPIAEIPEPKVVIVEVPPERGGRRNR